MDLNAFAQALARSQQAAQQSNPYAPLSGAVGQIQWNPNQYSTNENVVGGLLKGLTGGLFDGLGQSYVDDQTSKAFDALSQYGSGNLFRPEGMNASVFAPIENAMKLSVLGETLGARDDARKFQMDLAKLGIANKMESQRGVQQALVEAIGKNPYAADRIVAALGKYGSGGTLEESPSIKTGGDSFGGRMDEALSRYGGDEAAARKLVEATDPVLQKALLQNKLAELEAEKQIGRTEAGNAASLGIDFSSKQFDDAKKLSSIEALIPGTSAANEMAGIQTNLRTMIQQRIGREMNADEQRKLLLALPDWNDSSDQLELKKGRFNELIAAVSKGAAEAGIKAPSSAPASSVPSIVEKNGVLYRVDPVAKKLIRVS